MTVPSTDDAGSPAEDTIDVNAAESSPAEKGVGSYEDAIEAALRPAEATPASDEQDQDDPETDSPEEGAEPVDPDATAEEELEKFSKGAQRRIRELVGAKKAVEAEKTELLTQIETFKPKAERMDQILGYMQQHEIEPAHLDNAMAITAMVNRGDYARAIPVLENLLSQVRQQAGDVIPPDLQQQVNLGYITEAHAKELNRSRAQAQHSAERARKTETQAQAERAQREALDLTNRAATAADAWNQEQVVSDPDWNLKRDLVAQAMEVEIHRRGPAGYPRTEKDVRDLLTKAKSDVEAKLKRLQPAPKPIVPANGGGASPRSAAKPTSHMDAIEIGLAKAVG